MQQADNQWLKVKVEDFQNDGNYTFLKDFDQPYNAYLLHLGNKGIISEEKQIVPRYIDDINKPKIDRKLYVIHEKNKFYQTYEETYKRVIKAYAMSKVGENCKIYYQNQEFNKRVNYQDAFNNQINLFELFFLEKENQKQFVCIYSNVGLINIEFQNHPIIKRPQILQIQSINNEAGNLIDRILDGNLQNKKYGCLCKFGILNQFDSFDQLGLNSDFISIVVIPIPNFNIPVSADKVLVRFFTIYQCQSQETYPIQTKIRNTINCQEYILLISGKVIKNIDAYLYDFLPQNAKELNITLFEIRGLKPQQNDPLYLDIFYEEFLQNIIKQFQEKTYLEIQNMKTICPFKENFDMKYYNNVNNENLILIHFKNEFFQTLSNENKNSSIQLYAEQQLQDNNVAVYYKNKEIGNLKEKRFLEAFPTQELTELYVFKREINQVQVCIYSNSQIKQIGEIFRPKIICIESVDRYCSIEDFSKYYNFPYCFLSKFGVLNGNDRFDEICQGVDMCQLILLPYPDQDTKTVLDKEHVYVMFWEFGQPYNEGKQNGYFPHHISLRQLLDNEKLQMVINRKVVNNLDAQLGQFILKTTLQLNITLVKVQKIKEQVKNQPIFAELLLTSFMKDVLHLQNIDQVNALSPVFKIELQANL